MEEHPVVSTTSPSSAAAVLLREENNTTAGFVPVRFTGNITVRELAEEYCITSLLECDASGCVQPRAVALDSPLDILHSGKYYIPRRDVKQFCRSPRVTFRGKIIVEEFDTDHAVAGRESDENCPHSTTKTTTTLPAAVESTTRETTRETTSTMVNDSVKTTMTMTRKRRERDDDDDIENGEEKDKDETINANTHMFVPFVGDLYDDGSERLIQLKDAKRLCENVESDEAEFRARHDRAESILKEAKQLLQSLSNTGNASVVDDPTL